MGSYPKSSGQITQINYYSVQPNVTWQSKDQPLCQPSGFEDASQWIDPTNKKVWPGIYKTEFGTKNIRL